LASSNHLDWILNNIPKSVFICIRRVCSLLSDYYYHARNVIFQLLNKNYQRNKLLAIMLTVGRTPREQLHPYKQLQPMQIPPIQFGIVYYLIKIYLKKVIQ
jgi:hypothetical protein